MNNQKSKKWYTLNMGPKGNQGERPMGENFSILREEHNRSRERYESAASPLLYGIADLVSLGGGINTARWIYSRRARTPYTDWENLQADFSKVVRCLELKVPLTTWKEVELDQLKTELYRVLLEHDAQLREHGWEAETEDDSPNDDPPSLSSRRAEEIDIAK